MSLRREARSLQGWAQRLTGPALRSVLFIPLFGAVLVAALWAAVITRLTFDCDQMFADAAQDVDAFIASFEEHALRALRDVDRTALLVKTEFERNGTVDLPALARIGLVPVDAFVQVSVANRAGEIVASTQQLTSSVSVADREHFRAHQNADTGAPYVSGLFVDRLTRRHAFAVTRRLNAPDGSFAGTVIAVVDPRFFSDFYQDRYLGRQGLLAVLGTDGAFRARRIGDRLDVVADASRATVFARADQKPAGSFHAKSAVDGVQRFFAYRKLSDYPLILVAGRAESEIMAQYEARRLTYVLIASSATAVIVVFFVVATLLFWRLRRSQARALEAEALFRAASDAGLDAFSVLRCVRDRKGTSRDFVFVEANPRTTKLLEIDERAIVGRRLLPVLRRTGVSSLIDRYLRVFETGEPLDEEIELKLRGRPSLWLRHQVVRARDGIAVMARDITESKLHEEQLRQRTAFLQALVQNVPVGVFVRSARAESLGRVVVWNHACEYMYGATAAQTIGNTFRDFGPAGYVRRIEEMDRAMLQSPMVQQLMNEPIDAHGRGRRYLNVVRAPIFDADDRVEFIITIATDVTAEKAREDELRLASKVFETTADAVLLSDSDDRVIMVNHAFTELTGFTPDEMRGKKVGALPFAAGHLDSDDDFMERLKREGRVTEELLQHRKDGSVLPCWATASCIVDEHGAIANFVRVFSDISALKASQQQLERLANYDTLTGLPNRRLFQDRLELALQRARRSHEGAALLFIDLDGFKEVNDSIGHDIGDLLLREVASRLLVSVRVVDSVSRLGGDEFTVIIEDALLPEDAINVAQRVLHAMTQPFLVAGHAISTSVSIGIALFPQDGADATALLRNADAAMYKAKRAGRNQLQLFSDQFSPEATRVRAAVA